MKATNPPNLIDISTAEHRVESRGFALCYGHNGGMMTIGGFNENNHLNTSSVQTIKYKSGSQFTVHLDRIQVGEERLGITTQELNNGQGVFFDSGTTSFHGPQVIIE